MREEEGVAGPQPMSTAVHRSPKNFGDLTAYLTHGPSICVPLAESFIPFSHSGRPPPGVAYNKMLVGELQCTRNTHRPPPPPFPMDLISTKTTNPKCRLYWCLIEFIGWR
jgi:hypothetical protein